jgi:hypothetical protein
MFNCGNCGTTSKPGEGQTKIVIERRPKKYLDADGYPVPPSKHVRTRTANSFTEIVKEIAVGLCCAAKLTPKV